MNSNGLNQYSRFVTFATFLLIVAGGLVTSTGSGLSVPDWPLSYGQLFPPMLGGIRFEHTHRVIAGIVGFLTLLLAIAVFLVEKRKWVRWLGLTALLAVVAQAILGGVTVIYLLPTAVSVIHACLAQTFFSLLASLCLVTSKEWKEAPPFGSGYAVSIQRLFTVTTAFIYLQLIAGAIVRHTKGEGTYYHVTLAFLIAMHLVFILLKICKESGLREKFLRPVVFLLGLVVFQITMGFGAFIVTLVLPRTEVASTGQVLITTAHQANGALILATAVVLTLRSFRWLR